MIQTAKNEASGLFTNNPVLNVKTFKFTMPNGDVDVSGKLAFKGLAAKDLNNLGDMLKKTEADFNMSVPQNCWSSSPSTKPAVCLASMPKMKPQAVPASTISTKPCA